MYLYSVTFLMFILPIASILVEAIFFPASQGLVPLIGKWFVFWAIGLRLFLAGLRQALTPKFTAEEIFEIKAPEALVIVQELGFANISIGVLGISSLFQSTWIMPAAIVGGLFYGAAAVLHSFKKERNRLENIALFSDWFIFIVLFVYFVLTKV